MVTLFDQEKVMEIHDYHVAEAARKDGLQEGRAEGTPICFSIDLNPFACSLRILTVWDINGEW